MSPLFKLQLQIQHFKQCFAYTLLQYSCPSQNEMPCVCKHKVTKFYWYFRPLAVLAKFFGVLPLQNLHYADGSKVYFRYISLAHLYSTLVFITILSLFYNYSEFKFDVSADSDVSFSKILVAYLMITRSTICFVFCVHHSKKLPRLIKMLELFDGKKCCMLDITENRIRKFFTRSFLPLIHGAFYMGLSFVELNLFAKQILPPEIRELKQGQIAAIIFGILGDWQVLPLLLYTYFAFTIKHNFQALSHKMACYVTIENIGDESPVYDPNLSKVIENIRSLHTLMTAAVDQLSNSYGSYMAVDQLCITIMFVVNFYVSCYITTTSVDFHLLFCTLINAVLVLLVIMASHAVKETALEILEPLQCIRLSAVDEATQKEVQLFISQLASQSIEISAAGYFVMDRGQIPSVSEIITKFLLKVFANGEVSYTSELKAFTILHCDRILRYFKVF